MLVEIFFKRTKFFLQILCVVLYAQCVSGETVATGAVKRISPTERLTICLDRLGDGDLKPQEEVKVILEFAKYAQLLSPMYGHNKIRIDRRQWDAILSKGAKLFPENRDIAFALTQLLLNNKEYGRAIDVITSYHEIGPCHESTAWIKYAQAKLDGKEIDIPKIDIHFCVITSNPNAREIATLQQLKREVIILNEKFVTLKKKPIVQFRFKSASFYDDVSEIESAFLLLGDSKEPYDADYYAKLFNECRRPELRDQNAVNFYVYDSYSEQSGFKDITSHGKRNSNCPYVFIDFERLNNRVQNPEPHEMGHAFGLGHVSVIGAKQGTQTNIMTSIQYGFGSGGKRNLGLTEAQTAIVLYHANRTLERFKIPK